MSTERVKSWALNALSLSAVLIVTLTLLDAPLRNADAPWGLISLGLSGTAEAAQAAVATWDPRVKVLGAFGLGLDAFNIVAYASGFALLLTWLNRTAKWRSPFVVARLMAVAAVADAAENLAVFQLLRGLINTWWVRLAWGAGVVKFTLVGAAIIVALALVYRNVWGRPAADAPAVTD